MKEAVNPKKEVFDLPVGQISNVRVVFSFDGQFETSFMPRVVEVTLRDGIRSSDIWRCSE